MKILLAFDPFGNSGKVLAEAVRQVKAQGGELVILAVAETFQDTENYSGLSGGAFESLLAQVGKKAEEVKLAAIQAGVTASARVESGPSPAQIILECAEKEKADLIVMGHREKKGMDRFLVGSVASKIIAHARCSVLVVR